MTCLQKQISYMTPMVGTEGMPLRLTCKAEYDMKQCGRIDAFWCHHTLKECPKLIDPGKYLTIVNEMFMEDHSVRHRRVVTDFIQLTPADRGVYQCHAVCEMGGHTAMGHYINITVKGTCPLHFSVHCYYWHACLFLFFFLFSPLFLSW
uniref:Ig-like domain-containing protein n=1 Tax=Hucho hucho TaxID=62062 RepID=A0A4W5RIU6_9TELE